MHRYKFFILLRKIQFPHLLGVGLKSLEPEDVGRSWAHGNTCVQKYICQRQQNQPGSLWATLLSFELFNSNSISLSLSPVRSGSGFSNLKSIGVSRPQLSIQTSQPSAQAVSPSPCLQELSAGARQHQPLLVLSVTGNPAQSGDSWLPLGKRTGIFLPA